MQSFASFFLNPTPDCGSFVVPSSFTVRSEISFRRFVARLGSDVGSKIQISFTIGSTPCLECVTG